MQQQHGTRQEQNGDRGLIWTREDVVVTSGEDRRTARLCYYIKVTPTDEIFELGEVEHEIWRQFEGGRSLDDAQRASVERYGDQFVGHFRYLVAELAVRGLLHGAIPRRLLQEFSTDPRARRVRVQFQIDPDDRNPPWEYYRFRLFDPNRPFELLARWFWFLKYSVWPIGFVAILGGLVLIKHTAELHADFPPTVLTAYGIPHGLFTLFTINITRNFVMGAVIRHYGARIPVFSLDLRFGVWPRFHIDKQGILRMGRTPQLWAHSSCFFVRLAFIGFGTLGWWWFRGDGTTKSALFLLASQAGLLDLIISAIPFFRNETYYWFACFFEEPYLRERALGALRSLFQRGGNPLDVPPIERTALLAYGFAMGASLLLVSYSVVHMFMAYTGRYRGVGLALFLGLCSLVGFFLIMRRSRLKKMEAERAERRQRRQSARRGGRARDLAPAAEE